jgi:hypothetical protein
MKRALPLKPAAKSSLPLDLDAWTLQNELTGLLNLRIQVEARIKKVEEKLARYGSAGQPAAPGMSSMTRQEDAVPEAAAAPAVKKKAPLKAAAKKARAATSRLTAPAGDTVDLSDLTAKE